MDDNSPDGTAQKIKALQQEFPGRVFIEERQGKLGLGTAYIHGFKWGISKGYDFLFEMDCDFSHPVDQLPNLIAKCEAGADVCVGSRYFGGVVNVVNWPMGRVLMSYYASKYVKLITGLNIADTTAGFVCYKRKVLETIGIDDIKFRGYAFQIEMKYRAYINQFIIEEVPIIFTDRTKGQSKMSSGIIREAVIGVIMLRLRKIFNRL